MAKLGVNIDHIATLRQARLEFDPDPIRAALICEKAGVNSIVAHLREDRRHINDRDVKNLKKAIVRARFNLEMSLAKDVVQVACRVKPDQATLVPERRQEVTTEGGLDVARSPKKIERVVKTLQDKKIEVSLFIDPVKKQIDAVKKTGAKAIELHTGAYDRATTRLRTEKEFHKIKDMAIYAQKCGLTVHAGHGLKYHNTARIANIKGMGELNIGHSIISYAVFYGLEKAVKDMLKVIGGKR
ncbi:MAG: pyridoxine 5'-phosphate synthase [Candidatus Omnitrophica bacterium]|nr:pyridoxine 5'-phosphate synthase [Candidatus Omnitrophota bacterium]